MWLKQSGQDLQGLLRTGHSVTSQKNFLEKLKNKQVCKSFGSFVQRFYEGHQQVLEKGILSAKSFVIMIIFIIWHTLGSVWVP